MSPLIRYAVSALAGLAFFAVVWCVARAYERHEDQMRNQEDSE